MMVQKIYLIAFVVFLLSSCAKPETVINSDIPLASKPSPIVLKDIEWKVLSIEDTIYYGLTVADYQNLSLNMLELKRYIVAEQNIITYYESSIIPEKEIK